MDTVELEKLSSKKLRISAKETMKIAEKLYTSGFISYPRTETNIFPKELNLRPLVEAQVEDQRWGTFATRINQEFGKTQNIKYNSEVCKTPHKIRYQFRWSKSTKR